MKKLVIAVACLVLCVLLIVFVGLWNLGALIKRSVNTYGPEITGAEVHVEGVQTVLLSGEARLSNFYLGNPTGYSTPHAIKADSVYLDMDVSSLSGSTIIINKIELIHPKINYEKIKGSDNFKQIVKNINGNGGKPDRADNAVKGKGSRRLIIRDVIFRDAEVTLAISGLVGHRISARIQDIHLKNIGEPEGGLPPSEAFKILLLALYSDITAPKTIIEDMSRKTGRKRKGASDNIKKFFGK